MEGEARPDDTEFYQAMSTEAPLGQVIKAAIFIENQLLKLIESSTWSTAAVKRMQLSYDGRVNIAMAFGLEERLGPPLVALGNIRNRFAHRLEAKLSKVEVDAFYNSFAPQDKMVMEKTYQRLRKKFPRKRPSKLASVDPSERFALCVTTLRGALIVASNQATELAERRAAMKAAAQ